MMGEAMDLDFNISVQMVDNALTRLEELHALRLYHRPTEADTAIKVHGECIALANLLCLAAEDVRTTGMAALTYPPA